MTHRRPRSPWRIFLGAATAPLFVAAAWFWPGRSSHPSPFEGLPRATVHRAAVDVTVVVGGEVEGSKQTEINCDLENIGGAGMAGTRGLTILELVPNGSRVKKGDVLCRFDASGYAEMARLQEIEVEQAISEARQNELDLLASRASLRAYREGESIQLSEEYQGRIALAKTDLERARERLKWTRDMLRIGYVAPDLVSTEERSVLTQEVALTGAERGYKNHMRFTVPKTIRELEGNIEAQLEKQALATLRLKNTRERLKTLKGMVEKCTIKAPHDGLVVHADVVYGEDYALREGAVIHQGQPLFYLPKLDTLVAEVSLHESIAPRIKVGMPAKIRMQAFPERTMTGKVAWIAQLSERNWRAGWDIQHFPARITIDNVPDRVLPSMSAEVEIVTERKPDSLVVDAEAVVHEDGRDFCYVAGPKGLERRPVRVERANRDVLTVLDGLADGEEVVLHPRVRDVPSPLPGGLGPMIPTQSTADAEHEGTIEIGSATS